MISFLIAALSACVLALSGTVVILACRLHGEKKSRGAAQAGPAQTEYPELAALRRQRERAERLCMDIKRGLTHINTAAPSAIPGLPIERIRLLCTDELKDRVNAVLGTFQGGFTDRLAPGMDEGDFARLDALLNRLSAIAGEVKRLDETLAAIFRTWFCGSAVAFDPYEQRLTAVSRQLNELCREAQALLRAVSEKRGEGEAVHSAQERIRQASFLVSDPDVRAALAGLEALMRRHYDGLNRQTKARMETYYLQTLELVLRELGRAEQAGEDADTRIRLSIRVIRVLSNVVAAGQCTQSELSERSLEAEVTALERLAAMRGDAAQ